jgi:N-acetylglucosaminyl-diphospho-decaprenol L-rhamnosyltransferase
MTLSIVIVSFNARPDLENCLASLFGGGVARLPYDVTVVDNGSTDDSVRAVRTRWPQVQLIALEQNSGFAAASNVGIRATRGDLILLLNSDTVVPDGAIDALASRLAAHPHAAVAGPRLVDAHGTSELSFGPMISPLGELRQKLLLAMRARHIPPAALWIEYVMRRERYVSWVSGACLLVHRHDAEAVGLLDERYFLYTEDVDFCAAIRRRGRRILFTPAAEIAHVRGRSRAFEPDAAHAAYRRSQIAFYEKHHPHWVWLLRGYLRLREKGRKGEGEEGSNSERVRN